jgi:phage protein U
MYKNLPFLGRFFAFKALNKKESLSFLSHWENVMKSVNRRDFMKFTGSTLIGLTLGGVALRAQAQEQLSVDDATAKALNYTPASTVEGAKCSNCMYVQGADGEPHRPCNIFPGKLVNANGWCSAWVKKPG